MNQIETTAKPEGKPGVEEGGRIASKWPFVRLRGAYRRLLKLRGTPREIALGFALGLFVGMSPTMGIQTAIAVPVAALLGWNKISAAMGVWISNPASAPVLYSATYVVGAELVKFVTGTSPTSDMDFSSISTLLKSTPDIITPLVLGGIVLGIPIAVAGYYVSLAAVLRYRERIAKSLSGRVKRIKEIGSRRRERSRRGKKKRKRKRRAGKGR